MNDLDMFWFYVTADAAILDKIEAVEEKNAATIKECEAFVQAAGCARAVFWSGRFVGATTVDDSVPQGWKKSKTPTAQGTNFVEPDKRGKIGKENDRWMKKVMLTDASGAACEILGKDHCPSRLRPSSNGLGLLHLITQLFRMGGEVVLRRPRADGETTAPSIPAFKAILGSEYIRLTEKENSQAKAA